MDGNRANVEVVREQSADAVLSTDRHDGGVEHQVARGRALGDGVGEQRAVTGSGQQQLRAGAVEQRLDTAWASAIGLGGLKIRGWVTPRRNPITTPSGTPHGHEDVRVTAITAGADRDGVQRLPVGRVDRRRRRAVHDGELQPMRGLRGFREHRPQPVFDDRRQRAAPLLRPPLRPAQELVSEVQGRLHTAEPY